MDWISCSKAIHFPFHFATSAVFRLMSLEGVNIALGKLIEIALTTWSYSQTWFFVICIVFLEESPGTKLGLETGLLWLQQTRSLGSFCTVSFIKNHFLKSTLHFIALRWQQHKQCGLMLLQSVTTKNKLQMAAVSCLTDFRFSCILPPKFSNNSSFLSFSHVVPNPCPSASVSHGEDWGPNQECPQLHLRRRVKFHLICSV